MLGQFFRHLLHGWLWVGPQVSRVTNPVVLGALFFLAVVPTGLLFRLFRKDPLRLKFDPSAETYWIARRPEPLPITRPF